MIGQTKPTHHLITKAILLERLELINGKDDIILEKDIVLIFIILPFFLMRHVVITRFLGFFL